MWPSDPVELLASLYPRLLTLSRVLAPKDQADDLVQDTLVEMLARYPDFRGIRHPLGYARTVMFRLAGASRRRASRSVPIALQERLEEDVALDQRVTDHIDLQRALTTLGRKQRAAIVLRFIYKFPTREIAAVLESSEATVRSQVMRGMRRLKASLGSDESPFPSPKEGHR